MVFNHELLELFILFNDELLEQWRIGLLWPYTYLGLSAPGS